MPRHHSEPGSAAIRFGDWKFIEYYLDGRQELYDSVNDPHMIRNVIDDPQYVDVVKTMRKRLHDWMLETRDLGMLEETETLQRAKSHDSHWDLGQSLKNYKRILETADLMVQGKAAGPQLLARVKDPDSAVRFAPNCCASCSVLSVPVAAIWSRSRRIRKSFLGLKGAGEVVEIRLNRDTRPHPDHGDHESHGSVVSAGTS
ncbi:MAG: hypothetical protein CMJ64_06570 [Planctomycetaceae bacterium]|nr:hypothetical protein [Planctomycetaceae bacterium]